MNHIRMKQLRIQANEKHKQMTWLHELGIVRWIPMVLDDDAELYCINLNNIINSESYDEALELFRIEFESIPNNSYICLLGLVEFITNAHQLILRRFTGTLIVCFEDIQHKGIALYLDNNDKQIIRNHCVEFFRRGRFWPKGYIPTDEYNNKNTPIDG